MKKQKRMMVKSILITVAIGVFVAVFTTSSQMRTIRNPEIQTLESHTHDCQYGRCGKIKADGTQCKNCAQKDSYYCWSHKY